MRIERLPEGTKERDLDTPVRLTVKHGDATYEVIDVMDHRSAMFWLKLRHRVVVEACGTCVFGTSPRYGGEDDRHGLYCLRDVPDPSVLEYEWDRKVWQDLAWSCVDVFHVCPRFKLRPIPTQLEALHNR